MMALIISSGLFVKRFLRNISWSGAQLVVWGENCMLVPECGGMLGCYRWIWDGLLCVWFILFCLFRWHVCVYFYVMQHWSICFWVTREHVKLLTFTPIRWMSSFSFYERVGFILLYRIVILSDLLKLFIPVITVFVCSTNAIWYWTG